MDENYKRKLLEEGAILVILGLPEGTEFGIDLQVWTIGNKFKGIKLIPPGLHFYYFSIVGKFGDVAPRTGYFHYFQPKEIIVKKYDPKEEDIYDEKEEIVENIKLSFREIGLGLGPFPLECWKKWVSLTQYITKHDLQRLAPEKGKISSVPELINEDTIKKDDISKDDSAENAGNTRKHQDVDEDGENSSNIQKDSDEDRAPSSSSDKLILSRSKRSLPSLISRPGTEIRFSKFPLKPYKDGATPSEISKGSIDSSYTMSCILKQLNSPSEFLSEVQFSFICFLVGCVWDSWEHWRKLILAFSNAEDTLIENPNLFIDILSILHFQIEEVPEDLFADIVESNNFLVSSLRTLFANIFDNKSSLPQRLISKANKFRLHLIAKFHWGLELEEEGEDLPVVVEI